jgi:mono/diheme cytochrome c family protein
MTARSVAKLMTVLITASCGLAFALGGCSSSTDGTAAPTTSGEGGTTTATLSKAFAMQCERCHGPTGAGAGKYPKLPVKTTADAFVAAVRAGKGEMPAFSTSQISDADLRADYAVLTEK